MVILNIWPEWLGEPNWIEYATFFGGLGIAVLVGLRRVQQYTIPSRIYEMMFLRQPSEFPPAHASRMCYGKSGYSSGPDDPIYVRIRARHGISLSELDIRLVHRCWGLRQWRPWRPIDLWWWDNAPQTTVAIRDVVDAHTSRYQTVESPPVMDADGVGGKRLIYGRPKTLLARDAMWLKLEVESTVQWDGQIQFLGPSPDGRRAYVRRRCRVIPRQPARDAQGREREAIGE